MGMWAETCGVSNLPINRNEEVVAYLVVVKRPERFSASGLFSPTDIGRPASLGFRARYDGYGRFEGWEDNYNVRAVLEEFGRGDFGEFLGDVARNKVTVRYTEDLEEMLGIWMVRRDVHDRLMQMEFNSRGRAYWLDDAQHFADQLTSHKPPGAELVEHLRENEGIDLEETLESLVLVTCASSITGRMLTGYLFSLMDCGLERYLHWWRARFGELSVEDPDMRAFVRDAADLHQLLSAMRCLRRDWMPRSGDGSQNFDWELHREFALAVSDCAQGLEYMDTSEYDDD